MTSLTFRPASAVAGTVVVPPDKSLTHRAFLLGAISDRPVVVDNPLDSEDTAATLSAVRALGAGVEGDIANVIGLPVGLLLELTPELDSA